MTSSRFRWTTALDPILLAVLAALWGSSYALTKLILLSMTPLTAVAGRLALAAVVLWSVVLWFGRRIPRDAATWRALFVQSLLQSTIPFTMITWGQQFVDSGLAGVLNSTSPIFAALITALWTRHEPIGVERLAGLVIGLGGVVLVIGFEALAGLGRGFAGQVAIVLATVGFASAAIWGRRFDALAPEVTAAGTLTLGALTVLPFALLFEAPWTLTPTAISLWALLAQAVFGAALGFLIYFRLVRTLGSIGTASVGYLKAGVSVLVGVAVLNEPFTWSVAVGLTAVVVGVAAINRKAAGPERDRLGLAHSTQVRR